MQINFWFLKEKVFKFSMIKILNWILLTLRIKMAIVHFKSFCCIQQQSDLYSAYIRENLISNSITDSELIQRWKLKYNYWN